MVTTTSNSTAASSSASDRIKVSAPAPLNNKYNFRKNPGKGGMQIMVIHNSNSGNKGNIWLFWNKNLSQPQVVSISSQMVTVSIGDVLVSGVYAHVKVVQRRFMWYEMEIISSLNKPWIILGDFNSVLRQEEKVGGRLPNRTAIMEFNDCLNNFKHFQKKFEFQNVQIVEELLEVIPKVITEEDQAKLDSIPNAEEIKNIVFTMDPESAPGPDGFSLLLPKTQGARTANQFRPIGLSNVIFKIFTKIITTRMSHLMEKLVSPQQVAYIKGRSIHEQVILAPKMVNEMKFKRRGSNVGIKLDISQAYDSVSWEFLIKVLQKYGFSSNWCAWLITLLESAKVSVMVNGGPCGFLSVGRGLKQGDPLSPILFVLMSLTRLLQLLDDYQASSCQIIYKVKSKCFEDGASQLRKQLISEEINMELSKLLDKSSTRLVLVKSVLCSVPIYNMSIYKWPSSLIKVCERLIRNFLWTGDSDCRKFKTLTWRKVCNPYAEGGIGIRRLEVINKSLLMKMIWRIINSKEVWVLLFYAKFQDKHGKWTNNWKQSSVWKGLKWAWNYLKEDVRWCVGNGTKISVWYDIWYGEASLINVVGLNDYIKENIDMKVNMLLQNNKWVIPIEMQGFISVTALPDVSGGEDQRVWSADRSGNVVTKIAVEKIRAKKPPLTWNKFI
ncbi:uncharacterized protein LOC113351766 [Papaver somniferum]|uniref:uncharacterized protein LOC113351766 n=1 Tax=Papaver somniferum TaxID=3469 RepID=UPI000E6F96AB|nr:uncharacterized protein LOC113351766 [Papaver somniferum]